MPKTQLTTAVAQYEFVYSSCSLLGPALGSLLFGVTRLLPFVADAVSYMILLVSLLNIHSPMQDDRIYVCKSTDAPGNIATRHNVTGFFLYLLYLIFS